MIKKDAHLTGFISRSSILFLLATPRSTAEALNGIECVYNSRTMSVRVLLFELVFEE